MADGQELHARIVFWGPAGSGKTTNLQVIHQKLRPDHRGELKTVPTAIDPSVGYEVLPIELGQVGGSQTRIEIVAVPSEPIQAPTRKQLLDRVDGVVLVFDSRPERLADNLASFEELRDLLADYGRGLDEIPYVVEYNKRDLAESYDVEELHRQLGFPTAPAFEAAANRGTGVLQALTTVSKGVVRMLRERGPAEVTAAPVESEPAEAIAAPQESAPDASHAVDAPEAGDEELPVTRELPLPGTLSIDHVAEPRLSSDGTLRIPIALRDGAGAVHRLTVDVRLEPGGDEH